MPTSMPAAASTAWTLSAKKLKYLKNPSIPKFETMLIAMNARLRSGQRSMPRADA